MDLTGIEEIDRCRQTLERHNWDIEVAVQDTFNEQEGRQSVFDEPPPEPRAPPMNLEPTDQREMHFDENMTVNIVDEWKVYQTDDLKEEDRIDHYWRQVFVKKLDSGQLKYRFLPQLVKKAPVLPHRNSEVERSLSVNTSVVTKDRVALGEKTVTAIRTVKDIVKFSDPVDEQPHKIPLNSEILLAAKMAHNKYKQRIETEKEEREKKKQEREKERLEKKRLEELATEEKNKTSSMLEKEKALLKKEMEIQTRLTVAEELLKDGNKKLSKAVESSDMKGASVAQMMIATATSKIEGIKKEMDRVRENLREAEQQKRQLLVNRLDKCSSKSSSKGKKQESAMSSSKSSATASTRTSKSEPDKQAASSSKSSPSSEKHLSKRKNEDKETDAKKSKKVLCNNIIGPWVKGLHVLSCLQRSWVFTVQPRQPQGIVQWGYYIITLPFRFLYTTLLDIIRFAFQILRPDPRRNVTDPLGDVVRFIQTYNERYGENHPVFYQGSYSQALNDAKTELRFLLVYLHGMDHQDSESFCRNTLGSQTVINFINTSMLFWACDTNSPEGYRVSQALRENTYPFLALIVLRQNRMTVVARIEGPIESEQLIQRLEAIMGDNEASLVAARADREERSFNQSLRQQQDEAYLESLRQDQEKERRKREEKELIKAEEARKRQQKEDHEQMLQERENRKDQLRNEIPPEPESGHPESVRVVLKLPHGTRIERRFLKSQSLKYLYYFTFCHVDCPDDFHIVTNFPRKTLPCEPTDACPDPITFEEAGLGKNEMLFVQDNEA